MADLQTQKQLTLEEFCPRFVDEIDAGNITNINEAIARITTYTPVQEYFATHTDELSTLFTSPQEESLTMLRELFSDPRVFLPKPASGTETLTQHHGYIATFSSLPTETVTPSRIQAVEKTHKSIQDIKNAKTENQAAWIHNNLMPGFWKRVEEARLKQGLTQPMSPQQEREAARILEESILEPILAHHKAPVQEVVMQRVETKLSSAPVLNYYKPTIVAAAKTVTSSPEISKRISSFASIEAKATKVALFDKTIQNPMVYAEALENGLDEPHALQYARAYETIEQTRSAADSVDSLGEAVAEIIEKEHPGIPHKAMEAVLVQALDRAMNADGFIDEMTKRLGGEIVNTEGFKNLIIASNQYVAQHKASGGTGLLSEFTAKPPPSISNEEIYDYLAALERVQVFYEHAHMRAEAAKIPTSQSASQKGSAAPPSSKAGLQPTKLAPTPVEPAFRNIPTTPPSSPSPASASAGITYRGGLPVLQYGTTTVFLPSFLEFYLIKFRSEHPEMITLLPTGLIHLGAKEGATKIATDAGKQALGVAKEEGARKLGAAILTKFGLPTLATSTVVAGPVGFVAGLFVGKVVEWGGKIITATLSFASYVLSGGVITSILAGKPASISDVTVLFPVVLISLLAVMFAAPFLGVLNFADFPQTVRNTALVAPLEYGGGDAPEGPNGPGSAGTGNQNGQPMGPIQYTGPQPSGALSCANYNVSPKEFCDGSGCLTARPLSAAQSTTLNAVFENENYKSLGLYNCLLGCPAQNVSFYAGGGSDYWGWAAGTRSVVLYNGFFTAGGGAHAQARLLAHELAHTYMQLNPDLAVAFEQEGYCGKLCTYPSGTLGKCSPDESPRETFAESAAMYIVGEDLKSLCPKGYDFIDQMFRSCNQ